MNWDRIEGSWMQFKGKAQSRWGQLTDDDLAQIGGRRDVLIGKLQSRYGYTWDQARQEIDRWLEGQNLMGQATAVKDDVMQVADNFNTALRKSLNDNPRATLAMAAALGFVLGAMWKS